MKRAGFVFAAVMLTSSAHAEPATPNVTLTVTPGTAGGPWKLVVMNAGELPVLLAADPRLLTLELVPQNPSATEVRPKGGRQPEGPSKVTTVRCSLPEDTRPHTDEGHELVVPGKRSWSLTFDPLYYCFGARERGMLVSGTTVKASFGWPSARIAPKNAKKPGPETSPFVVAPVGASVGQLAPMKALEASSFTLGEAVTAAPPNASLTTAGPAATPSEAETRKAPVSLSATEATDVARGVDVPITLTLTNDSDRPVTAFFRSSTIVFTVNGPAGSVSCGTPRSTPEPFRELFTTIGPKQKSQTTMLISALCPAGTFDEPGIYRALAKVDTRGTSGRNIGLKTWDGEVAAKSPSLLRVRSPRTMAQPAKKPQLD